MDALKDAIVATRSGFDIQNDLSLLDQIKSNLDRLNLQGASSTRQRKDQIDDLSTKLQTIKRNVSELKTSDNIRTAKKELLKLEDDMFKVASNLTTYNMELNSLKLTYNQNLKKLDDLEVQLDTVKAGFRQSQEESSERANLIKLKLYESLGLKLNNEKHQVLVWNRSTSNAKVLKIDDCDSDYIVSNYIWGNI